MNSIKIKERTNKEVRDMISLITEATAESQIGEIGKRTSENECRIANVECRIGNWVRKFKMLFDKEC